MSENRKGKLIVIEGGDGSGKTTQSQLLIAFLQKKQIPHVYLDFPQYDTFYGKLVARFLRGELGSLDQVSPYLAALTFALDRMAVAEKISQLLDQGNILVVNRYVTSNIAHQGGKFTDEAKRNEFISWLEELEYEVHKLPKPDIVIYLKTPAHIATVLTKQKEDRPYLQGKEDIQEQDTSHRKSTEEMYDMLSARSDNWITILCTENDIIRSKEDIHHDIVKIVQEKILPAL